MDAEEPRRISESDVEIRYYDAEADPDNVTREDLRERDDLLTAFLAFFTGLDDDGRNGFAGVTLTVSGTAVSGMVISEAEWQEALLANIEGGDVKDGLAIAFEDYNMSMRVRRNARKDRGLPRLARKYIHLRDVMIGTGKVATLVPLWRGRVSDVSGWSVGSHNGAE